VCVFFLPSGGNEAIVFPHALFFFTTAGFFPHKFNTPDNQTYIGPIPNKDFFDYNKMPEPKKIEFDVWYSTKEMEGVYNLSEECDKYCLNDVLVLRECLKIKRRAFMDSFGIDCFDLVTAPSAVCLGFQYKYLKSNTIGIVPAAGYGSSHNQSAKALEYIAQLEVDEGRTYQTCRSAAGEAYCGGLPVDAFHAPSGTVVQFHGCYWHSCLKCYPHNMKMNTMRMMTHVEIRDENERKAERIRLDSKVKELRIVWECEWDERKKEMKKAGLRLFDGKKFLPPCNPRDHLFGGRTECFRMYANLAGTEKIGKVYDFVSLYSRVMIFNRLPIGHPEIIRHDIDYRPAKYFGLVYCTLLPPDDLYVPVLPTRLKDKRTLYTLCRSCAEERRLATPCTHFDDPDAREITGAWISPWIDLALSHGYKIKQVHEVHHFAQSSQYDPETRTGGVFAEFMIDTILKKILTTGFPKWCVTEEDKIEFCMEHLRKMGVVIRAEDMTDNPGARESAKVDANSSWGR